VVVVSTGIIERFGKYELIEKIASGGMAEVYRARSRGAAGFEKILVIKKILPNLAKEKEFKELFIDEARIAVQLLHVNIVQVFDLGEIDGQYFMAMEYVQGLDLSRLLSRARALGMFPIPLALFIIGEVLKALQFAHLRCDDNGELMNIVHCDISPQNILISFSGEVKLTDFGISRAAFQMEEQHQIIRGKYAYMAPEQVEGKVLDGRTDLFALTIVLYEALTGRRLFKAKDRNETLSRVRRAEVPSPRAYRPEISDNLEEVLFKGLAKSRKVRYKSAGEMLEAISKLMIEEGHRATNNDLAAYLKGVVDAHQQGTLAGAVSVPLSKNLPPTTIISLSVEASPPPRSLATPRLSISEVMRDWGEIIKGQEGEVWEKNDGSLLAVWIVSSSISETAQKVVSTAIKLRRKAKDADYKLSVGIAPGVARISSDTNRPADGWELAGPFYLARWMMNLSAHRGRILITEVVSESLSKKKAEMLGRIPIQGNRYINLFEL
jgi:serine/threonine protein kinase